MTKATVATNASKNTKKTSTSTDIVTMNGKKVSMKDAKQNLKNQKLFGNSVISVIVSEYCDSLVKIVENSKKYGFSISDLKLEQTYSYIAIGNKLTKAKKELTAEEFNFVCKTVKQETEVTVRTLERYMELVQDDRVSVLKKEDLKLIKKVSKEKLLSMTALNDTEFKAVMKGDDSSLKTKKAELKKTEINNLKSEYKNIKDDDYRIFVTEGLEYTLEYLNNKITELKNKQLEVRELKREMKKLSSLNKSQVIAEVA